MTTGKEILESIASAENGGVIEMPVRIAISKSDAMGAKLLLWLVEQMPEEWTSGDMHDALDAAKWWQTLLDTMRYAKEKMPPKP
jgi:hypothetical protein